MSLANAMAKICSAMVPAPARHHLGRVLALGLVLEGDGEGRFPRRLASLGAPLIAPLVTFVGGSRVGHGRLSRLGSNPE
jgi:hypothetical protein